MSDYDYEFLPRNDMAGGGRDHTMYYVTISKTGPRGGKRPPLMKARLRAYSYNEAVEYVETEFFCRTRTEVRAG